MGIYKYIKITFNDDIKKSAFYMLVLILSITIIFNMLNITLNENIVSRGSDEYKSMSGLALIVMFVFIVFTVFANSYYMGEKYKEYAIVSVAGRSISDICKMMLIRSFIVTCICVTAGCIFGNFINPCVMKILSCFIGVEFNQSGALRDAIILTVFVIAPELEIIFLVNIGTIYRSNINNLINRNKKNCIPKDRIVKISPIIYISLYVLPLIVTIMPLEAEDRVQYIKTAAILGLLGIQGLVRFVIPDWIKNNRNNKGIENKYKIIELSNLYSSVQKSRALILTMVLTIILTIEIGIGYRSDSLINNISVFCYVLIIVVMSLTVVYKFLIEARARKNNFQQLRLIGYALTDIQKIIIQEVRDYYLIVHLLVMPYIIALIAGNTMAGLISVPRVLFMIGIYIIVFFSTSFISYKGYSRVVFG